MKPTIITDDIEAAKEHATDAGVDPEEVEFILVEEAIERMATVMQENAAELEALANHPDPRFAVQLGPGLVMEAKVNAMLEFLIPQGTIERVSWSLLFEENYMKPLIERAKDHQRQAVFGVSDEQVAEVNESPGIVTP